MSNKSKKEFQEEIQKKKAILAETIKEWSEDDIKKHMAKVADVYTSRRRADKLGNFDYDKENVYYWHTYDDNPSKLPERMRLGWGFATREDASRAGLTNDRVAESVVDGESCVEMSHKSHRAILLKIPRELYEMNQKIKERIRNNRPVLDADGNLVDVDKREVGESSTVGKRKEQMVQIVSS